MAITGLSAAGADQPKYAEGQVWEYHTRPSDAGSLLRIQKIENLENFKAQGPVYHISIIGVHFADEQSAREVGHLPVSQQTLDASVTQLSSSKAAFPDPTDGIAEWRKAQGGVFSIPVPDIVTVLEQTLKGQQNPQ